MNGVAADPGIDLPPSTVYVLDGQVIWFEKWVDWHGTPHKTIEVRRGHSSVFSTTVSDPIEGHCIRAGALEELLDGFGQSIQDDYLALFGLDAADEAAVRAIPSFRGYQVKPAL